MAKEAETTKFSVFMSEGEEESKKEILEIVEGEESGKEMMTTIDEKELATKILQIPEGEKLKNVMLEEGEELKIEMLKIVEGEEIKKVILKSSDGVTFEVEPSIVKEMQTIQSLINAEGTDASITIPLPNVTSRNLNRIIEYCSEHYRKTVNLKEFDERFLKALSHDELKELLLAANYLNIKALSDFLCKSIADLIQNKNPEFIRKFFNIVNDFTPEEETQIREANAWAFEGMDDD
ncbi:SKP1-like protein 14 [Cajanus cajan]|uniref:SKP1-like protein 14 n=1 Tax=Cajanus cajan TaxID=3821 RepID=UPI00098D80E4|nr:SKP1-like protein 14 [Cajanus cajan]